MTRVLHLSDPHFGAADRQVADALIEAAAVLQPDLTVLSGDLTMRARRREMRDARDFVDRLPMPHFVIPGNHDIPAMNHPLHRFFRPFDRYSAHFGDDLEPEHSAERHHLVSLNSTRAFGFHPDWSEGRLSPKQLRSIGERFQQTPTDCLRLIALHHPLLAPINHRRAVVKPLPDLLHEIAKHRVDLVFCGHFHRSQLATAGIEGSWRGIVSQAPTACSVRLQGEPQGFHLVELDADHAEIVLHQFESGTFVRKHATNFRCDDAGWRESPTSFP